MATADVRTPVEEITDAWRVLAQVTEYAEQTRVHLTRGSLDGAHRCAAITAALATQVDDHIRAARHELARRAHLQDVA